MKKTLLAITTAIGVALVALLVYSVERSAWLLSMYEAVAVEGGDTSGPALAMAAALVAELGAIALIVGEAAIGLVGNERTARRLARWAGFGLLLVLSLQSVAGLVAGYTSGGDRMLATLGGGNDSARFWVAAVALLLGNLTVPGLILALSKIAAILVGELVALAPAPSYYATPSYAYSRPAAPAEVPIYVEPASISPMGETPPVLNHGSISTNVESGFKSNTSNTPAIADKVCKYCGAPGLTQAQLLAHGRARARKGVCPA